MDDWMSMYTRTMAAEVSNKELVSEDEVYVTYSDKEVTVMDNSFDSLTVGEIISLMAIGWLIGISIFKFLVLPFCGVIL